MKFLASSENLHIVMQTERIEMDAAGNRMETRPLRILAFSRGQFNTIDKEEIAYLRKYKGFGRTVFEAVAPDDMVATGGSKAPVYVCGRRSCRYQANSMAALDEHKAESHPKKKKSNR